MLGNMYIIKTEEGRRRFKVVEAAGETWPDVEPDV